MTVLTAAPFRGVPSKLMLGGAVVAGGGAGALAVARAAAEQRQLASWQDLEGAKRDATARPGQPATTTSALLGLGASMGVVMGSVMYVGKNRDFASQVYEAQLSRYGFLTTSKEWTPGIRGAGAAERAVNHGYRATGLAVAAGAAFLVGAAATSLREADAS